MNPNFMKALRIESRSKCVMKLIDGPPVIGKLGQHQKLKRKKNVQQRMAGDEIPEGLDALIR